MSFDSLTLECFLAVVDAGSFTKAARKVARTQSAVSQQIAKLESLLGKPLFLRKKNFTLTAEGELFLNYAREIVKLNHEAMDRFRQPELHGEVRFGIPEDFATVFLSDVLSDYAGLHPRILLKVECDLTLNLFEKFKNDELDLALLKMNRSEDLPNSIKVWSEALEWVGDHKFFDTSLEQVVPLVVAPQPCVYRSRAIQSLETAKRKWHIVFSSPSFTGMLAAVRAGMGVAVMARNMIPDDMDLIKGQNIPTLEDTQISLLKQTDDNPAVNSFEAFVVDKLRPGLKEKRVWL